MAYYVDTSAWVEYFRGSPLGNVAAQFIEGEERIITHTLVIAELRRVYLMSGQPNFGDDLAFIQSLGALNHELDRDTAISAGEIRQNEAVRDTSLIDCIQVALARREGHLVLAKDTQFLTFPEGRVLEYL